MYAQTQKKQNGFSLIEMMVAMIIGLFLMGGVLSVYISSIQSSRVNTALRTMQENGRFALSTLKNSIQLSGYINTYDPEERDKMEPFPAGGNDDELTIRYQADTDCTGADTTVLADPDTGVAENTIEVTATELRCTGNAGGAGNPQTIVDGVDEIRILYGLDDDDDADGIADRYVKANTVDVDFGSPGWKKRVVSVRIALLMNSVNNVKPGVETKSYNLLDKTVTLTDSMLHKVFTTTILLRNPK